MIGNDCPTCQRPVDGLFCAYCGPKHERPPITPENQARIDAARAKIAETLAAHRRKPRDREAEIERDAIQQQDESTW